MYLTLHVHVLKMDVLRRNNSYIPAAYEFCPSFITFMENITIR